jgi:pyridoxal phosphate enzyme (YggS family)
MIAQQLHTIKSSLPLHVTLVAVSKTKPVSDLQVAYDAEQRDFGENKVQELVDKYAVLPKDIRWHMIGHLQTNKVKYIVPFVHLIHGVDSLKLLQEIEKQASKVGRKVNTLLQYFIATEETKFGLSAEELEEIIDNKDTFSHINFCGLMGMASFTNDENTIKKEFSSLKKVFDTIQSNNHFGSSFNILSMGMSGDYTIAIDCGSSMIRVGSSIFGVR